MALRLAEYTVRILKKYVQDYPGMSLPVVIPMVYYNGERVYP